MNSAKQEIMSMHRTLEYDIRNKLFTTENEEACEKLEDLSSRVPLIETDFSHQLKELAKNVRVLRRNVQLLNERSKLFVKASDFELALERSKDEIY